MSLVPEEDRNLIVSLTTQKLCDIPGLHTGSFVRIRSGQYRGDIAYVVSASSPSPALIDLQKIRQAAEMSDSATPASRQYSRKEDSTERMSDVLDLWVIPRFDYFIRPKNSKALSSEKADGGGPAKKKRRTMRTRRLKPKMFDPVRLANRLRRLDLLREDEYCLAQVGPGRWTFMNRSYEYGFLRLRVYGLHAVTACRPKPEDIFLFAGTPARTKSITNAAYIVLGDCVNTRTGRGTVVGQNKDVFRVRYEGKEDGEDQMFEDVSADDIERVFEVGQWVKVMWGQMVGRTGVLVSTQGPELMVVDTSSRLLVSSPHSINRGSL